MVRCRHCSLPIPQSACLCTHCHSYQDWRRWFAVSGTVLALLTALITVLTFAVPNVVRLLHTPRSEMAAPMINLEGTTIRLLVNNDGDAPGVFVRAFTESEYLAGATKIRLRDDQRAIIAPGSNLLMFDVVPLLNQDQSYRNSIEMIQLIIQNKEAPKTDILFVFGDSDGTVRVTRLSLNADQLFELFRANADRCSAVQVPDFYNGCIGPGELQMDDSPAQSNPATKDPASSSLDEDATTNDPHNILRPPGPQSTIPPAARPEAPPR